MPYAAQTYSSLKNAGKPKKDYRPSSYKRGYGGKQWHLFRRKVFLRDNYTCQECNNIVIDKHKDHGKRPHCDHITPHNGNKLLMWSVLNAQTLCGKCHSYKTAKTDGGFGNE